MRQVSVPNLFFEEAAHRLKESDQPLRLRVNGESMLPYIIGGEDEVTLTPYHGEPLALGTCAFYHWGESYMIHRLVKQQGTQLFFMGDGNLARIEEVAQADVLGILKTLHHPDGGETDCLSPHWQKQGMRWYRLRFIRRYLLKVWKMSRKKG